MAVAILVTIAPSLAAQTPLTSPAQPNKRGIVSYHASFPYPVPSVVPSFQTHESLAPRRGRGREPKPIPAISRSYPSSTYLQGIGPSHRPPSLSRRTEHRPIIRTARRLLVKAAFQHPRQRLPVRAPPLEAHGVVHRPGLRLEQRVPQADVVRVVIDRVAREFVPQGLGESLLQTQHGPKADRRVRDVHADAQVLVSLGLWCLVWGISCLSRVMNLHCHDIRCNFLQF